ncbi:MAG: hydantoinase B/oxoprolinase family protein [Candidatus Thorarchaeota archaeon]
MIEDPVTFEVIKNALISCAREMSLALRLTAFSPNIKERRDCSCALFDAEGRLIAQSKDIPVHLGAMPLSVRSCIKQLGKKFKKETMALVNDPFSGGSHLPDLTLVAPVYAGGKLTAFTANRAHHADVGGISPGSMPGNSTTIHEEGLLIKPRIVVEDSQLIRYSISDLLTSTRTPDERLGDLSAQVAANNVGRKRLAAVAETHSWDVLTRTFDELRKYSAKMMQTTIRQYNGMSATFTDHMDTDGTGTEMIPILVEVSIKDDRAYVTFQGTSPQVTGNINCPLASSLSAVYYVFITLFGSHIPTNEGCWSVIDVHVPEGSLLNPRYPAAVSAGNVETTQRIVDVTLGALSSIIPERVPAASQGTMNNVTIGGTDPRTGNPFSFYETIGGGAGAVKGIHGTSAIHVHMTNTLNTPIEALETAFPLRISEYSIRPSTGGAGRWRGGNGIVRQVEILADDCTVSIQSERREIKPWGLFGGEYGEVGRNLLIMDNEETELDAKITVKARKGSIVRIETPGGGGWGEPTQ